jgi:hypothetical protein
MPRYEPAKKLSQPEEEILRAFAASDFVRARLFFPLRSTEEIELLSCKNPHVLPSILVLKVAAYRCSAG